MKALCVCDQCCKESFACVGHIMKQMSNVCVYETRIKRPFTSGVTMETYNKWRDCKTHGPRYELKSKLSKLSELIWNGDISPEKLKNLDAYLKRWNKNPCSMVLDMLTVNTTCLDAFLKWQHDAFPSPHLPLLPPPPTPSSFLSPICYQTKGTCDPSKKHLHKLQTYLYRFQYHSNGCLLTAYMQFCLPRGWERDRPSRALRRTCMLRACSESPPFRRERAANVPPLDK